MAKSKYFIGFSSDHVKLQQGELVAMIELKNPYYTVQIPRSDFFALVIRIFTYAILEMKLKKRQIN